MGLAEGINDETCLVPLNFIANLYTVYLLSESYENKLIVENVVVYRILYRST